MSKKTKQLKFKHGESEMSEEFIWAQVYASWRASVPKYCDELDSETIDAATALVADRAVLQFRKRAK